MIDTPEGLKMASSALQDAPWVAVDTEADSLHAYPEKLCLIQISIPSKDFLVDPLAGLDLTPILDQFQKHRLILHGADYDLRMFRRTYGFVPTTIFDTMWAARLLGYPEFSLTHLVSNCLGIQLEKGPQKMDWARRPLSERMEKYARNDTHFLFPLSEMLKAELKEKGRLTWLEEVCARVIQEASEMRPPDPDAVWRIKGSDRLPPAALAILRELWAWREEEAIRRNKPPYFILSHERLIAICEMAIAGHSTDSLIPHHFSSERQTRFEDALKRGIRLPQESHPPLRKTTGIRLSKTEQNRFNQLRILRDHLGEDLKIDPTLIASRSMMVGLAQDWPRNQKYLMNWQRTLLAAWGNSA